MPGVNDLSVIVVMLLASLLAHLGLARANRRDEMEDRYVAEEEEAAGEG